MEYIMMFILVCLTAFGLYRIGYENGYNTGVDDAQKPEAYITQIKILENKLTRVKSAAMDVIREVHNEKDESK